MGYLFIVPYRYQSVAPRQSWCSGKKNNTLIYYAFVYQLIIYLHKFWSAYVSCSTQYKDAIQKTWEQIDVVHRMVEANPTTFEFVTSAQGYKKI